ncbi:hypothetical protein PGIGA_G00159830 [Pangasianodon gigas]|uniref:Uncharacterized protein n=1 Tax=Pangasianodon gigas TaxID=30993 RepID=A0ACC5XST3_PANGG|nr:hypothetical protein [Pangasianodon gigas]
MLVTIYSLFVVIHLTSSLNVDIPLQTYELARGGNGTIPCNFKPQKADNPSVIISWTAHPDNPDDSDIEILTYYYFANAQNQLDIDAAYTDRASLQVDIAKGWANLTLKALTSKDSRVFQCEVKIPGDSSGKLSDTTTIVVLVAPSKPICAIQGTAEFYHNINLTCRSEEGTPKPTYRWQSYDVSNNPRSNPPKSTDVNGVLSLYNISAETSGYYICTSTNKIRNSMKIGSTAGIIGGCAVALLLLIIIICCCVRRRKNKSEYAKRPPEDGDYTDKEPQELEEYQETHVESKADRRDERSDRYDDQRDRDDRQGRPDYRQYDSDRYDDRRSDRYDDRQADRYDDRQADRYDDRRSDRYDDRQADRYDDRRSDRYDDRRSDRYDDRHSDRHDDRRSDRYDDRRSDRYDEPRDRYDDRNSDRYADRYDDRRDRYDHPDDRYDGRSRPPNVPANKPTRG